MIEKWLLKLARWIASRYGYSLTLNSWMAASPEALSVVADVEQRFAGASGEHKRHQALALLMKQGLSEREAAWQIELAVEQVTQ